MKILVLASASVLAFAAPAAAQSGFPSNVSYIEQVGNANNATLLQSTDNAISLVAQQGSLESVQVEQSGATNYSQISQGVGAGGSSANRAVVLQSGTNGKSSVQQLGTSNYANVTFSPGSTNAYSLLTQGGTGNSGR